MPGPRSSFRFAAATCIDALCGNKARLAGSLEVLDIKINLSLAAKALQAYAESLRETERNSGAFGIAELVYDQFTSRERLWKQLIRIYGNA